jgi:hypothetical protein
MKKFLLVITLSLFLSACTYQNPDIFSISNCEPPCWAGITPEITKTEDVKKILSDFHYVNNRSINYYIGGPAYYNSFFVFHLFPNIFNPADGDVEGRIYTKSDKVEEIMFSGEINYTLEEFFNKLGEPSNIQVFSTGGDIDGVNTILYNKEKGYLIQFPLFTNNNPDITPSTKINGFSLISSDALKNFIESGVRAKEYAWDGYGNIFSKYPYP